MGSLLYFAIIAVQITNSFAIDSVPLNFFFRNYNSLNKCSADAVNTFNTSTRFGVIKLDHHRVDKDGWVLEVNNIKVHGMDDAILDDYSYNYVTKIFQITFHTDLLVKYSYQTSGYLFSKPIKGEGLLEAPIKDIKMGLSIPFDFVEKDGQTFMELHNFNMWYNVRDKIEMNFSNLYNGDTKSSNSMHSLMNKHWDYMATNFGKEFLDRIADQVFQVFRKYMLSQPLDF